MRTSTITWACGPKEPMDDFIDQIDDCLTPDGAEEEESSEEPSEDDDQDDDS